MESVAQAFCKKKFSNAHLRFGIPAMYRRHTFGSLRGCQRVCHVRTLTSRVPRDGQ